MSVQNVRVNSDGATVLSINDVDIVTVAGDGTITLNLFSEISGYVKLSNGSLISGPVVLSDVEYDPSNTGNWSIPVPTTAQEALDRLAAALGNKP